MLNSSARLTLVAGFCACSTMLAGCSGGPNDAPKLGAVTGIVKLDGAPIEGVKVMFESLEVARSAIGETNKEGKYELSYGKGVKGAPIGKCRVKFDMPMQPEKGIHFSKLPIKYMTDPQFEKEVAAGKNEFNFELSSEGASDKPLIVPQGPR